MARVYSINVSPLKGETISLREATLKLGKGIDEDRHCGGDREISLMAKEALSRMTEYEGLCTSKFFANIVTEGLDYHTIRKGGILRFGDCAVELTDIGKACYEKCPLLQEGRRCPLTESCAFGRVVRQGKLRVGVLVQKDGNGKG